MLVFGETPDQRKRQLLARIKTDRWLIRLFTPLKESSDHIRLLREEIKSTMKDLTALERWRRKEGYRPDQPYKPPSLVAYEASMTEEDKEAYLDWQAALDGQIEALESKLRKEHP